MNYLTQKINEKPLSLLLVFILFMNTALLSGVIPSPLYGIITTIEVYPLLILAFLYALNIESKVFPLKSKNKFLIGFICLFLFLSILWSGIMFPYSYDSVVSLRLQIVVILCTTLFFHRSLFTGETDSESWSWQVSFVKASLETVLVIFVFGLANIAISFLLSFLFSPNPELPKLFAFLSGLVLVVTPALALFFRLDRERKALDNYSLGIINYLGKSVWALYVIILSGYALTITINWTLPKGTIALLVSIAFILFAIKWWSGDAVMRSHEPSKRLIKVEFILNWLQLALLGLYWVSVTRRIADYGFTHPRYILVCLGLFYTCFILLALSNQLNGRRFISSFLIFGILSLVNFF